MPNSSRRRHAISSRALPATAIWVARSRAPSETRPVSAGDGGGVAGGGPGRSWGGRSTWVGGGPGSDRRGGRGGGPGGGPGARSAGGGTGAGGGGGGATGS